MTADAQETEQNGAPTESERRRRVLRIDVDVRTLVIAVALVVGIVLIVRLWPIVVVISVSLIFMATLLPFVDVLERRGVPRSLAAVAAVALPLLVVGAILAFTIPSLVIEFRDIDENLPRYAREADGFLEDWGVTLDLESRARDLDLSEYAKGSAAGASEPLVFGALSALTAIVITAYLLNDAPRLSALIFRFVPRGQEADAEFLLVSLRQVVGGYVRGQLLTSAAITLFTLVVMTALRAPNPVAFAFVAGFADIVPLIGAFLAIVPAVVADGWRLDRARRPAARPARALPAVRGPPARPSGVRCDAEPPAAGRAGGGARRWAAVRRGWRATRAARDGGRACARRVHDAAGRARPPGGRAVGRPVRTGRRGVCAGRSRSASGIDGTLSEAAYSGEASK